MTFAPVLSNWPVLISGFRCLVVTLLVYSLMTFGGVSMTTLTDDVLTHVTTASLLSLFLSLLLFVKSLHAPTNTLSTSAGSGVNRKIAICYLSYIVKASRAMVVSPV